MTQQPSAAEVVLSECQELHEEVRQRNAAARMSRWLWPHLYHDYQLFERVQKCLEQVELQLKGETWSGMQPWIRLPAPPSFDVGGQPQVPPPLRTLQEYLNKYVRLPHKAEAVLKQAQRKLGGWLKQEDGLAWFDQLVRAALAERTGTGGPGLEWLQALLGQGWCHCYPEVDLSTGQVTWPQDLDKLNNVERVYNDQAPGTVLEVTRFAPSPQRALCSLSLGPEPPSVEVN